MSAARPLVAALAKLGADARALEWHEERAWNAVSFSGMRHRLCYLFAGPMAVAGAEGFLARLEPEALDVPGHLVADAQAKEVFHNADPAWLRMTLELLVLEES